MNINKGIKVSLIGLAMGIAETIPGVSGGTIAFIFRIYNELLNTIKSISPNNITLLFKGRFGDFFRAVNGKFFLILIAGMVIGIALGVFGISYLLETYPLLLWSFFFGLVLASAIILSKDVSWDGARVIIFILGTIISFGITLISPSSGNNNLFFIALCGMIAISALMLPGLSGSFILLLLGMYSTVIKAVKNILSGINIIEDLYIVLAFALGCLIGLFTFSRVLSFTFKKYFHSTMALMIGVLLGSLNKLWPWRIPSVVLNKNTGEFTSWREVKNLPLDDLKIISEQIMMPSLYSDYSDPMIWYCLFSVLFAIVLIFFLSKVDTVEK